MLLRQIGFVVSLLFFLTPVFASQCPPADKVRNCRNGECNFQQLSGWSGIVYYTDQGKAFEFQKERVENTGHGREISCFYSYLDPDTNRLMPPALVLHTIIN